MATTKEYYAREFPPFESFGLPEVSDAGVHLKELYEELVDEVKNVLPGKSYVGNCTKEFAAKLLELYGEKTFAEIQGISFPDSREHPINDEQCERELSTLLEKDKAKKTVSVIIKKYHPSLNEAHRQGCLSPLEGWREIQGNYKRFLSLYENRLRCSDWFKEKDNVKWLIQGFVPEFIWGIGLSTSRKYPQVSYFKPHLAKYIVDKYLEEYDNVFDPFAGYCGRMLGVLAAGKDYVGQDLCESTIQEDMEVYQQLYVPFTQSKGMKVGSVTLSKTDSTEVHREVDCLFTCPPYSDLEQWPGVDLVKRGSDEWIDICLENYQAKRYVFVVDDDVNKYRPFIKETLENTSHFGRNNEYVVVIDEQDRLQLRNS